MAVDLIETISAEPPDAERKRHLDTSAEWIHRPTNWERRTTAEVRALPVCKIKPLPRVQALSLGYRPLDCHGNAMKHRLRYRHRATVHGWQISWDPDNNRLAALRAIERLKSGDDCTEVMSAMWKPLVASTGCGS